MKRFLTICMSVLIVLLTLSLPVYAAEDTVFIDTEEDWSFYVTDDEGFAAMDPTWKDPDYKDSWSVGSAPFGDRIDHSNAEQYGWQDYNHGLFLRKSFKLRSATVYHNMHFYLRIFYDNSVHVYLNGTEIFAHDNSGSQDWVDDYVLIELDDLSDLLLKGENILAVSVHDNAGGRELDLSFFATVDPVKDEVVTPPDQPDDPGTNETPQETTAPKDFGNGLPFTNSVSTTDSPIVTVYVTAEPVKAEPAPQISYTTPITMVAGALVIAILMVVFALLISRKNGKAGGIK